MNFLFTHRSVVDIQRNVMKFRGKIITHYEHSTLSGHEPLGQSVYFIFVTWVCKSCGRCDEVGNGVGKFVAARFWRMGQTPETSWIISRYELSMMEQER